MHGTPSETEEEGVKKLLLKGRKMRKESENKTRRKQRKQQKEKRH